MRLLLWLLVSLSFVSLKAQTALPSGVVNYLPLSPFPHYTPFPGNTHLNLNKKWQISTYSGLAGSFGFFRGGQATVFSAPVGLQLSRPLNNNLYAFAGISAVPAFTSFNRAFTDPGLHTAYPGNRFSNTAQFGFYSKIEAGLMYVNDEKTFSISGSIGISRGSYPFYPVIGTNTVKQQSGKGFRQ